MVQTCLFLTKIDKTKAIPLKVDSSSSSSQVSIVGGGWVTDRASAARVQMTQVICQLFKVILTDGIIIPQLVILGGSTRALTIFKLLVHSMNSAHLSLDQKALINHNELVDYS